MRTDTGDDSRARDRRHAVPERAEQLRLRSTFGAVLRLERGHVTQQMLADAARPGSADHRPAGVRCPQAVDVERVEDRPCVAAR